MNNLENRVFQVIRENPGQKANQIATQLGVDKKLINSALYGQLILIRYQVEPNDPWPSSQTA